MVHGSPFQIGAALGRLPLHTTSASRHGQLSSEPSLTIARRCGRFNGYERLRGLKRVGDPGNLFGLNHNVAP
jgi:hypothetical protein